MEIEKSQFEYILQADCNQFRNVFKKFMILTADDIENSFLIAKESLILTARWSDIASNSSKFAIDKDINKTDFKDWAYQRYRILQDMSTTCRTWNKQAKEDYKSNQIINGGT